MSCDLRLCFHNATELLRTIRLEPWARQFLLGPDERLEIIARATDDNPSLRIVEANETTLIYTEGSDEVRVVQDGTTHDLLPVHEIEAVPVRTTPRIEDPMFDRYLDISY
jgi:hypothetical protein